jgi:hypothetical protein
MHSNYLENKNPVRISYEYGTGNSSGVIQQTLNNKKSVLHQQKNSGNRIISAAILFQSVFCFTG